LFIAPPIHYFESAFRYDEKKGEFVAFVLETPSG